MPRVYNKDGKLIGEMACTTVDTGDSQVTLSEEAAGLLKKLHLRYNTEHTRPEVRDAADRVLACALACDRVALISASRDLFAATRHYGEEAGMAIDGTRSFVQQVTALMDEHATITPRPKREKPTNPVMVYVQSLKPKW